MRIDKQKLLAVAASIAMTAAILASQAFLVESSAATWKTGTNTIGHAVIAPLSHG